MQVGTSTPVRDFWYDRNPLTVARNGSDIAGSVLLPSSKYTTPANRILIITSIALHCYCRASPSAAGFDDVRLETLDEPTAIQRAFGQAICVSTNTGDGSSDVRGLWLPISAGESVIVDSVKGSTGGTVQIAWSFAGVEIDA